MKFNKKMLFAALANLILGIFGIIAFFAIKFRSNVSGDAGLNLTNMGDLNTLTNNDAVSAIYGCGVAGLVFAFIGIVFPLVSMFYDNEKLNKAFGFISLGFAILGTLLMVISVAVFAGKCETTFRYKIGAGYVAGQFIFILVGGALAIAGNIVSYKEYLAK